MYVKEEYWRKGNKYKNVIWYQLGDPVIRIVLCPFIFICRFIDLPSTELVLPTVLYSQFIW